MKRWIPFTGSLQKGGTLMADRRRSTNTNRVTVHRNSINGQFTTESRAKTSPNTTEKERIKRGR